MTAGFPEPAVASSSSFSGARSAVPVLTLLAVAVPAEFKVSARAHPRGARRDPHHGPP